MQRIPLTNDFTQRFDTVLNNQSISIRVWYQEIGSGWYFSMSFQGGSDIVTGHRIKTGSPMLSAISSSFIGNIVCIPLSDQLSEPGRNSPWGDTHVIAYLTPDESLEAGYEIV